MVDSKVGPVNVIDAFALLKQHLTSAPVVVFPDYTKAFILDTDATMKELGLCYLKNMMGRSEQWHLQVVH